MVGTYGRKQLFSSFMKEAEVPRSTSRHIQWSGVSRFLQGHLRNRKQESAGDVVLPDMAVRADCVHGVQFVLHPISSQTSYNDIPVNNRLPVLLWPLKITKVQKLALARSHQGITCHKFFRYMIRC